MQILSHHGVGRLYYPVFSRDGPDVLCIIECHWCECTCSLCNLLQFSVFTEPATGGSRVPDQGCGAFVGVTVVLCIIIVVLLIIVAVLTWKLRSGKPQL